MASIDSKTGETDDLNRPAASRTFDKIGTAAAEFNDADTGITGEFGDSSAAFGNENTDVTAPATPLGWMIPLFLLFLLISLGYAFCRNPAA